MAAIVVDLALDSPATLALTYRVAADFQRWFVPRPPTVLDPERLWAHTCCELFVGSTEADDYVEWNFSPTGQVRRFAFTDYRKRADQAHEQACATVHTPVACNDQELRLEAKIPLTGLSQPANRLALAVVLETHTGELGYWALRHPRSTPDFHHRAGFALALATNPPLGMAWLPENVP